MTSQQVKVPESQARAGAAPAGAGPAKTWLKSLAALVLLGFMVGALVFNQSIKSKAKEGSPAPEWRGVTDLDGKPYKLADFRGKPLLLNIWTTWCVSCKEETPALQAFHERYGDKIRVVGLDVREPIDTLKEYMKNNRTTYLILRDQNGNIAGPYNVRGYPESWFIDAQGIARKYWEGPMTFEQMQEFYAVTTGEPIDGAGVGPVAAGNRLSAVALDPAGGAVYVGTAQGLFRSKPDGGWEAVTGGSGFDLGQEEITAAVFAPGSPPALYAAGSRIGVVVSRDAGRTWQDAGKGLPAKEVAALAAGPRGDVLAWVRGHGLFRSADGGATWSAVGSGIPADSPVVALAVDPGNADRVLLAMAQLGQTGWEGRLFRSDDGGRNWSPADIQEVILTIPTRPVVFAMAFDPAASGTVYLATNKGVWKSTDGGKSARWSQRSHARQMTGLAVTSSEGRTVILAGAPNGDLYRSEDGGGDWKLEGR